MLRIRLLRIGKKNQPSFKIVVIDKKKASTHGHLVEEVGFYNPPKKEKTLKTERIKYWLSVGVQPSDTVYNLLVSEGIIEGKKRDVHKKTKKETEEKPKEGVSTPPEEKPAEEKPGPSDKTPEVKEEEKPKE